MSNELTALDAIKILADRAQWCREEGESDMRNILHTVRMLRNEIASGKTRDEIISSFTCDLEDDDV